MKIWMEPTKHIMDVDGVEYRLWNGVTERDTQVFIFVHSIALRTDQPNHPDDEREVNELFRERWPGRRREI